MVQLANICIHYINVTIKEGLEIADNGVEKHPCLCPLHYQSVELWSLCDTVSYIEERFGTK